MAPLLFALNAAPWSTSAQIVAVWIQTSRFADVITTASLFVIGVSLLFLSPRRRRFAFPSLFFVFAALFLALAAQHVATIALAPRGSAAPLLDLTKGLTALLAAGSAGTLLVMLPKMLRLQTRDELRQQNLALDDRVHTRTSELTHANEKLAAEIQQRERAEGEIRRLNASLEHRVTEWQTLFTFIPIGVGISADVHCTEIQMNPALAQILGLPATQSLVAVSNAIERCTITRRGQPLPAHQHPMRVAATENLAVLDYEITVVRDDDTSLEVLVCAVPLRSRTGHARGCVATFQDITQRKRIEKERLDFERRLQETQKLESLGVLSGGIAHDFNNLLTGVLGHANLARFALDDGREAVEKALDQVELSAQRAADLCRQLLAYAGKGRFNVQPINLNQLIQDTSPLLTLSLTQRASLKLDLCPELPALLGDITQLRQVIMNLVLNAAEAIPPEREGQVLLQTRRVRSAKGELGPSSPSAGTPEMGLIELVVSDNGAGMSQETLAKIFDPFFTTKFTGRGLGLAAVQGIVRSHQGSIDVVSEPDRGTTFTLRLPAAPGIAVEQPVKTAPRSHWRTSGKALVIDDEETVRHVAQRVLEQVGLTVTIACDGAEGVARFRAEGPFRLVLLDLTMPRMDGEQTFRALHSQAPHVPVLLMSGFSQQGAVERLLERGIVGFVPKPFTVELLTQRVRHALEKTTPPTA